MAIAKVTYHSFSAAPRYNGSGDVIGVLPAQVGDRVSLTFTTTPDHGAVQDSNILARVLSDTDCGIGITGSGVAITLAKTRPIKAGVTEDILIPSGSRLGIIAES